MHINKMLCEVIRALGFRDIFTTVKKYSRIYVRTNDFTKKKHMPYEKIYIKRARELSKTFENYTREKRCHRFTFYNHSNHVDCCKLIDLIKPEVLVPLNEMRLNRNFIKVKTILKDRLLFERRQNQLVLPSTSSDGNQNTLSQRLNIDNTNHSLDNVSNSNVKDNTPSDDGTLSNSVISVARTTPLQIDNRKNVIPNINESTTTSGPISGKLIGKRRRNISNRKNRKGSKFVKLSCASEVNKSDTTHGKEQCERNHESILISTIQTPFTKSQKGIINQPSDAIPIEQTGEKRIQNREIETDIGQTCSNRKHTDLFNKRKELKIDIDRNLQKSSGYYYSPCKKCYLPSSENQDFVGFPEQFTDRDKYNGYLSFLKTLSSLSQSENKDFVGFPEQFTDRDKYKEYLTFLTTLSSQE